ncbi:hypothetical protein, partial [Salmonella enterica]|uniref:hypothetical protein n=1 Tax=Salmonella enterica TaxID=28901 RepID=UPI0020C2B936
MSLHKTLKFHIAGETIDDYLGLDPAVFYQDEVGLSPNIYVRAQSMGGLLTDFQLSPMQASGSRFGSHFNLQAS